MGDYKWRTYEDLNREAGHFGRGLRALGHMPKQNVVIFAETRAEWMVAAHACFKQNFPSKYLIYHFYIGFQPLVYLFSHV